MTDAPAPEPSEWDDASRLQIWAAERETVLELRGLEDGTWQAHLRFEWNVIGNKSFDITSARSASIEEACADVVRAMDEAGIDSEALDAAVDRWSAALDARIATRESVTESVTDPENRGNQSAAE